MANDFSGHADCKALWRFENGALIVDSKGGNTLTSHNTPTADLVDFKEGAASVELNKLENDYFDIADAALDADFPFKTGDVNIKISICFWFKHISLPGSGGHHSFFSKKDSISFENRNVGVGPGEGRFNFVLYDSIFYQYYVHASLLLNDRWYHVGATYQDSDNAYRIRIWDDTAGAILGVDKTGIAINAVLSNWPLEIGYRELTTDANIDEMVVFDRVLSPSEIDKIRTGRFDGVEPPVFGSLIKPFWFAKQNTGLLTKL